MAGLPILLTVGATLIGMATAICRLLGWIVWLRTAERVLARHGHEALGQFGQFGQSFGGAWNQVRRRLGIREPME